MLAKFSSYLADVGLLARPPKSKSVSRSTESRRPPSVTIEDLPNELLGEIGGYLNLDSDQKSHLYALCLSSRTLNDAATPLLYSWFSSTYETSRLHKLVRTLSKRRELAKHMKSIVLYTNLEADAIKPSRPELITYLEAILPVAAGDGSLHSTLAAGFRQGIYNVKAILLLLLAERLETLTMVPDITAEVIATKTKSLDLPLQYNFDLLFSDVITWATASTNAQKPFAQTHTVVVHAPQDGAPIMFPGEFMTLPNIDSLRVTHAFSFGQSVSHCAHGTSPITRLKLDYCMLSTTEVARIIRQCFSLVDVDVIWDAYKLHPQCLFSAFEVDVTRLRPALEKHSQTLKSLRLMFPTSRVNVTVSDFHGSLGSLSAFTALESLELDECLLFAKTVEKWVHYWTPTNAFEDLSNFLPENLVQFTLRTRKDSTQLIPILIFASPVFPASLKAFDMYMPSTTEVSSAGDASTQKQLESLLKLDDECSSVYIRQHESGSFALGPETEFSLRHDNGIHVAIKDFKTVEFMAELWKNVEDLKDGEPQQLSITKI